jgi:hypothetical protein
MKSSFNKLIVVVFVLASLYWCGNGRFFGQAGPVSDDQAAKYAGRKTLVHGMVEEVKRTENRIYVNFGGSYPFQTFSAVLYLEDYDDLKGNIPVAESDGSYGEYWVDGRIELVDGRAQIRLIRKNQLLSDGQFGENGD